MRLINRTYMKAVLPYSDRRGYHGLPQRWRKYEAREGLSLDENLGLQWESLRALLQHAFETVPFYRHRFEVAGLNPEDIRHPDDLARLPLLTRADLRESFDDLWSRKYDFKSLMRAATGGTTDTPVPFLRSPDCLVEKNAAQCRFNAWAGMFPGDKVFRFWAARQDFPQNPSWRWKLYDRVLQRQMYAPTSVLNDEVYGQSLDSLNRFQPQAIYGIPSLLSVFCEFLRDRSHDFHRPQTVICTAEALQDRQREVIESVLGCKVFEHYGSREFGMIAGECEYHQGLHLNPATAYVEFLALSSGGDDNLCEIVVTDLLNYGMPQIRYKVNDCAIRASRSCPCGRGYPLVTKFTGRTNDNFVLLSGDLAPGVSLLHYLDVHFFAPRDLMGCPGLVKFQVVQEAIDKFLLRFVPSPSFSKIDLARLRGHLDAYFGKSVIWRYEPVEDIPRERSGKTRVCVCLVPAGPPTTPVLAGACHERHTAK